MTEVKGYAANSRAGKAFIPDLPTNAFYVAIFTNYILSSYVVDLEIVDDRQTGVVSASVLSTSPHSDWPSRNFSASRLSTGVFRSYKWLES